MCTTTCYPHIHVLPATKGASADPLKIALFRAGMRAYAACREAGAATPGGGAAAADEACVGPGPDAAPALRTFERLFMTAGEHTWG